MNKVLQHVNLTSVEENSTLLPPEKYIMKLCIGCVNRKYIANTSFEIISTWSEVKSLGTE